MPFLVPIDLTAPSLAAIELAVMLGRALGDEAIILHVSKERPALDLLGALYEIASPLRQAGVVARLRTVQGNVGEQIVLEAKRRRCNWVVMGTRGRLQQPESVAASVLQNCEVPVLAVRPAFRPRELAGVYLWSRPRSQAPWAWDIAGLLANSMGTRLVQSASHLGCNPNGPCSEDSLLILDLAHVSSGALTETLGKEPCAVLLVNRPTPVKNAQQPVANHPA